jgi:hypothetical protein
MATPPEQGTGPAGDGAPPTVVAATFLEARAIRRAAPAVRIVRTRVGLGGLRAQPGEGVVVSVGLAGGLAEEAETGTVVVPDEVVHGERRVRCDDRWSGRLAAAARALGYPLLRAPLLSSDVMVTGYERARWAALGFAAVDMETGRLAERAASIAAVRVVLDAPGREISPRWRHPLVALLDPSCWGEAVWLVRHAPFCARRAAGVLASALQRDVDAEI